MINIIIIYNTNKKNVKNHKLELTLQLHRACRFADNLHQRKLYIMGKLVGLVVHELAEKSSVPSQRWSKIFLHTPGYMSFKKNILTL